MGYSHYWQWEIPLLQTEEDEKKFAQWSRDVGILVEHYPSLQPHWAFLGLFPLPETWDITIRGPLGVGEPEVTSEYVAFNGDKGTGNSHDTFHIHVRELREAHFWESCKTGHCPYDLLVIAALVRFYHYFPTVAIWSDGEETGLDDGAKLCLRAFDIGVNPLLDPAYREYVETTIANWKNTSSE